MEEVYSLDLLSAILYHGAQIAGTNEISMKHKDLYDFIKRMSKVDKYFGKIFQSRIPSSYSEKVDNAFFLLKNFDGKIETQWGKRKYIIHITENDFELPKDIEDRVKECLKKIKESEEFKKFYL